MPVQHSPTSKNTRSRRNPAVLTPTARVPLDGTPSVHQLSANLDRGPPMEGEAPSRRGGMKSRRSRSFPCLLGGYPGISEGARARLGEVEDEEGEESVEEEDSGEAEVEDALANAAVVPQDSNLAPTNQSLVSQSDPSILKILEQMATIMGQLSQATAFRNNSKAPVFKTPSMKAPDSFDGTRAHKLRRFIQSYPSYLLKNWKLFETQLFTLFGDPNEVRKAEQELDNLRMKEGGHLSLYIADFRSLMSGIGDWGGRAYIHVYRRGLASRPLDQLAAYPENYVTLQELIDSALELDTRYHERNKEKGSYQEKKPPVTGSHSARPPQDSSSKRPSHKKNKKGKQFQVSKDKPNSALLNKDNKLIGSEKERKIKEGLCTYCGGINPIEKCFKRPQNTPVSSKGIPSKQGKA
ncbi:hypothetical protein O181_020643 [Austropuccinia psidii MF-1]|uniref:Retrotransposon gag domain-containing protein n=1 Tax=Austropuccinia psidii MF-1 TaxID=1389203 RepID=A0A9Q3CDB2_9BASI|nr:hypothetical protein [Austropuccinia psidii MF-1]